MTHGCLDLSTRMLQLLWVSQSPSISKCSFESLREHQEHPPKSSVHFLCSAVNWWVNVGQSSILKLSWDGDSLHAREKPQLAGSPAHKGWGAYYGAAASESTFRNWKVFPWFPLVYKFSTSWKRDCWHLLTMLDVRLVNDRCLFSNPRHLWHCVERFSTQKSESCWPKSIKIHRFLQFFFLPQPLKR